MKESASASAGATAAKAVAILTRLADLDTVHADVYRRRARELLGPLLGRAQYEARGRRASEIEDLVRRARTATVLQDWQSAAALAEQADRLRAEDAATSDLAELGAKVWEGKGVAIDPFSPGFAGLPAFDTDTAAVRATLVEELRAAAAADPPSAAFYDARRGFFAALAIAVLARTAEPSAAKGRTELAQLAEQAAARGDMTLVRQYARELLALEAKEKAEGGGEKGAPAAPAAGTSYRCPVDLAAPFPEPSVERGRLLGFAAVRIDPPAAFEPLLEFILARIWQARPGTDAEKEGIMRAHAMVDEAGSPPELAEMLKVLVGQFLRNLFVNSGGARYLPPFGAETALVEDFPDDEEPPAAGDLLSALGLPFRRGLARQRIDEALLDNGAVVLRDRLELDPYEFRLVCIPPDLFTRCGRERGWGQQRHWTHLDGYQVLRDGTLRALVGGDVRYGGLNDLASIALNDERDSVVARFAVIRRARHVARWH